MFRLIIILVLLTLAGCSVRFPQVESALGVFKKAEQPLADFRWLLTMGNYSTTVLAVTVPNGTVFANEQGDAVFFDGKIVRRIIKLGARTDKYEVFDQPNNLKILRQFSVNQRVFSEHSCEPAAFVNDYIIEQRCVGEMGYKNTIEHNKAGKIIGISQVVDYTGQVLTLRKL